MSITGTSINGPITVARATVGLNAVIAIAIAISKSLPVAFQVHFPCSYINYYKHYQEKY
jgi:hypothetical protein